MDVVGQFLHEKMRKLCIKRQNGSTLLQKTKWTLYEKKYFESLIEDIKELVDALAELFPVVKQEQLKLCEVEVTEIGMGSLSAMTDIVRSQDRDLEAAIFAAKGSQYNVYADSIVQYVSLKSQIQALGSG